MTFLNGVARLCDVLLWPAFMALAVFLLFRTDSELVAAILLGAILVALSIERLPTWWSSRL